MAYVGIQTMLLAYKMQKTDKESQLAEISQKLLVEQRKSNAASDDYTQSKAELDKDDPNYDNDVEALKESYKDDLAEIEAWEEELEQQKSDCETEISMLKGYIDSWQTALQSNIQKSHTYGAQ
ncbi:MAG: hypothetical protein ACI37S_05860 [Candidatus Gastranaerophilaceae bacterium]